MAKKAPVTKPSFTKIAFTPQALLAKPKAQGLIANDDSTASSQQKSKFAP